MLSQTAHPFQLCLERINLLYQNLFENFFCLFVLGSIFPFGKLEEHKFDGIPCQLPVNRYKAVAASKHNIVLILAALEVFELFVVFTVVDNAFKDELVFSQSTGLVKSHNICSSSKWNLFGLTDENLFLLKIENRIVDCQIENHGKLRRHDSCKDQYASQE